jgi:carbamoyltransferase
MQGAFLGPSFSDEALAEWLRMQGIDAERVDPAALPVRIAELIDLGKVIGLFQGRMEFGPRSLGSRSIIGDARSPSMQSVLNLKIKFRESFRPFAPAVLRECVSEWFEFDTDSPYMLMVAGVRQSRRLPTPPESASLWGIDKLKVQRSVVPAVTHVDYSARIQTVRRDENPFFYDVIQAFYQRTGCPVIVNTSFNVKDEPIVCTPEDAYRCFMKTGIDVLVLGSYLVVKPAAVREALPPVAVAAHV